MRSAAFSIHARAEGQWRRQLLAAFAVALFAFAAGQVAGLELAEQLAQVGVIELLIFAGGAVAVLRWPHLGVLALVALIYTNASEVAVRNLAIPSPLQVLALGVAAGLALRMFAGERPRPALVLDPLLLPLTLYLAAVFASSLVAADPALSDERLTEHLKGLLFFLVLTNAVLTPKDLRRAVWALLLAGAAIASISVFQVLTHSYGSDFFGFGRIKVAQIVGEVREPRIAGPLSDPNFYAQILVSLVPLAIARVFDERRFTLKLVAAYALGAITLAAVFTYSRGGALALGLVLILSLVRRLARFRYLIAALLVVAPLSLAIPAEYTGRLVTLRQMVPGTSTEDFSKLDTSFRQRSLMTTAAWEMFLDRPLLGVGAGNYTLYFQDYSRDVGTTLRSYEKFGGPYFPHSTFAEILAETGIPGFVAYAAVILMAYAALAEGFASFRRLGRRIEANITASIAIALTAHLVTSVLLHAHYVQYLWVWIALAASARQVARRLPGGEVLR